MTGRALIIAGCVISLIVGALPGLVLFLCVSGALMLLIGAAHRGYYRD